MPKYESPAQSRMYADGHWYTHSYALTEINKMTYWTLPMWDSVWKDEGRVGAVKRKQEGGGWLDQVHLVIELIGEQEEGAVSFLSLVDLNDWQAALQKSQSMIC